MVSFFNVQATDAENLHFHIKRRRPKKNQTNKGRTSI